MMSAELSKLQKEDRLSHKKTIFDSNKITIKKFQKKFPITLGNSGKM